MSVRAVMLPPQICAHVAIFQLLMRSLMKTILTTAVKSSIVQGSFLTKNDGDMSVPRRPKQEAAKVDISSHCAIPLLNHTHFKIHIPNTILSRRGQAALQNYFRQPIGKNGKSS